jgi:hypothetical protein
MSLSPEELKQLTFVTETITRPAKLSELKARLQHYKSERSDRIRRRGGEANANFGASISDKWLAQAIEYLENAIANYKKSS